MKYCCGKLEQVIGDFSVWDDNFIAPPVPDDGYKNWWMWMSKPDKGCDIYYCPFCGKKLNRGKENDRQKGESMEKKKVTKEFIKRWNETLLSGYKLENIHGEKDYSFALEMMFREIGVGVEGKNE